MKKIIPFNNVLQFNTDIREITAISLEHDIKKYPDMITGVFNISGEYKITDGQVDKEKFNFELPFDIALSQNYDVDTLLVDIDDFRYDIVSDKSLKVNIDLYIDGEIIEPPLERNVYKEELPVKEDNNIDLKDEILSSLKDEEENQPEKEEIDEEDSPSKKLDEPTKYNETKENVSFDIINESPERINLLNDMLTNDKENDMNKDININIDNDNEIENENINNNIFNPTDEEEKYVTYRVYKVLENDTLDTILSKYNITKEDLSEYNNIENITLGDKLIIPTNEK